jgi:hypothetical protein
MQTLVKGCGLSFEKSNGVFTQSMNRKHHRVGHLFQGRYKALLVDKSTCFLELCRYIVLNPIRAHMVNSPMSGYGLVGIVWLAKKNLLLC